MSKAGLTLKACFLKELEGNLTYTQKSAQNIRNLHTFWCEASSQV